MDYKSIIYGSYRSSFKGDFTEAKLRFGAAKLAPVIQPWVVDADPSLPVVDLGCGAGELLFAFKALGFQQLKGCDLSGEQVAAAQQFFPDVVEQDLFAYLTALPDGSVGIVTVFDVIEHLGPQASFELMTLVRQKLAPGGLFIAHLPNGQSPFVGSVFWGDMTHEWCLTPQSAKTFCLVNGFENFDAAEHLGTSNSLSGKLRAVLWKLCNAGFRLVNTIETGSSGGQTWTRNFAFKCSKPAAK